MVCNIQPPAADPDWAENYNEKKTNDTNEDSGKLLATRNVPEGKDIRDEFMRLQMLNLKTTRGRRMENFSFHMSINPGEKDRKLSDEEIVNYADELMSGLGYGDSPYKIFKHTDIARLHYHVVTTRVGQDGKKISDTMEHRRLLRLMEKLQKKYGYIIGDEENEKDQKKDETKSYSQNLGNGQETTLNEDSNRRTGKDAKKSNKASERAQNEGKTYVPPFDVKDPKPTMEKFREIHNDAMKWSFSTPEQYQLLMRRRYNVRVDFYFERMFFIGRHLDAEMTHRTSEKELGIDCYSQLSSNCDSYDPKRKDEQRKSLEKLLAWCADNAKSFNDFRELVERKGVYMTISWTDDGKAFGITWLDRRTKTAWKGSDTSMNMKWLTELTEKNGWTMTRNPIFERKQNNTGSSPSPTRTEARPKAATPVQPQQNKKNERQGQAPRTSQPTQTGGASIFQKGRDQQAHSDGKKHDGIYEDEAEKIMSSKTM